ncbi:MAG: ABC transporter ATP-binding protein [bacterium]
MVEVDRVSKNYGRVQALADVSFSVKDGEILGLLGPNAAGKTTLMRILTGYLPASGGTARVAGYDVFEDAAEVKRRIGYLPENPPLYGDLSVDAYLRFVCEIKEIPKREIKKRVDEVVDKVKLGGVRSRLVGNLSRGFKQRVGLAQALLTDPPVLILDEPTVGMDPRQIIEVRNLIKGLRGSHTVIFSSHIIGEVSAVCERVVILHQGKILAGGTFEELVKLTEDKEAEDQAYTETSYARAASLEKVFLTLTEGDKAG